MKNVHQFPGAEISLMIVGICALVVNFATILGG
jgi:hypothetical protein